MQRDQSMESKKNFLKLSKQKYFPPQITIFGLSEQQKRPSLIMFCFLNSTLKTFIDSSKYCRHLYITEKQKHMISGHNLLQNITSIFMPPNLIKNRYPIYTSKLRQNKISFKVKISSETFKNCYYFLQNPCIETKSNLKKKINQI